ncbi:MULTISPECIES: LysR family transcriptional regulator [Psychrobacter]|uniref:LysR family transcriptional regulator n=1 Tax=Psychrobacter fozii TaxID=198480 RepID=A0A2V4UY06_9GAMM|nr:MULTISPECIES: LysR family transcriptional regulator [Psychrobacter]MBF0657830.1 LysR family transcriptional regulator [Psychrobacter sp. NG25]MBH0065164.1 LysR family transcriptional regulator [Psychrobacter sp. SZ93C1]MBH0086049.1 LysR family transcriptional regulator [Psychrobacter sp. SCQQ22]PYE38682.1 LysR family transcriptional regulator [Psychrobacter fozii]
MDLKQLNAFIAIADLRSFSAAATKTGLSQPSLSRLLKQLETDMGVELIDRYHRPLDLTEAGAFFYDKISTILTEIDTVTSMTQRLSAPSSILNIGFVPSVLYGLLPEIIAMLKQSSPDIEVNLKDISSYQQIEALKSGEIDIGFGRFAHKDPWIQQILLRHERYVVALPKAHALAHIREQRLIDLANNRLILYHQTHLPIATTVSTSNAQSVKLTAHTKNNRTTNKQSTLNTPITEPLLHLFAQYGISPFMTTTVSDLQVALGLVAAGEGITLVPASLKTVRTEQISYQSLVHENVTSPIYLHTLKDFVHPSIPDLLSAIYHVYEQRGITYRQQKFM